MTRYYAYEGLMDLNKEPLGTFGKALFDLKTDRGAIRRCRRIFQGRPFRLYTFSNFYDDKTFREINPK